MIAGGRGSVVSRELAAAVPWRGADLYDAMTALLLHIERLFPLRRHSAWEVGIPHQHAFLSSSHRLPCPFVQSTQLEDREMLTAVTWADDICSDPICGVASSPP